MVSPIAGRAGRTGEWDDLRATLSWMGRAVGCDSRGFILLRTLRNQRPQAPRLDDANIGRFTHLVRDMSQHSQFIVITHNKRTMQAADVLYGVTMEEPGISKVISVAMH